MTSSPLENICPKAPDAVHVIDLETVRINWDDGWPYVDVNCEYCGRSGCLAKVDLDAEVDW